MPFGAHPPGYSELCGKQHFLSQMICAYKVSPQSQMYSFYYVGASIYSVIRNSFISIGLLYQVQVYNQVPGIV